jgi:uncharacterized repeat protein (TIGR03803 family)
MPFSSSRCLSFLLIVVLAACSSGVPAQRALPATSNEKTRPNTTESVLYEFTGGNDGASPVGDLTYINGAFFGTTAHGGPGPFNGYGTVFKVTTSGEESVLYRFAGGTDGENPVSRLTLDRGNLYGTTPGGGSSGCEGAGCGTVFEIPAFGNERVLVAFGAQPDAEIPVASLTKLNGVMYGTTQIGGTNGFGTIFQITTSGTESVLYTFAGGTDGANPYGDLVNVNGTLYGTTHNGGGSGCGGQDCGTVFKITTAGQETVLHSFGASGDGINPSAGLTKSGKVLYGTTTSGGAGSDGTVFKITTAGAESVVHSFVGADGANPYAALTNVRGALYGTSSAGGAAGHGTVFLMLAQSGTFVNLYSFRGSGDGADPFSGVLLVNGTLYGTTRDGGANNNGTVYAITLSG